MDQVSSLISLVSILSNGEEKELKHFELCTMSNDGELRQHLPKALNKRWKSLKSKMYELTQKYDKEEIIHSLLSKREQFTAVPTLSDITLFTGYDIAISTISNWQWNIKKADLQESDVDSIGKIGAEIVTIHAIGECLNNELLEFKNNHLEETEFGKVHFQTVNSFNVDVTGSRMDIARKKFMTSRMNRSMREKDPVSQIISVRNLYWENSILMLLRAPLPFYRAMRMLKPKQQKSLLDFHSKLMEKAENHRQGIKKVRLKRNSNISRILSKISFYSERKRKRPTFVTALRKDYDENKFEFFIAIGLSLIHI